MSADATPPSTLRILYRGPLSSCNYECGYCPFAKHVSSRAELARDEAGLARFVDWVREHDERPLGVLFTPWGEALVRRWYRAAMVRLSRLAHVERVAAQTNLTGSLAWLDEADKERLALWVTWHPSQIEYAPFLARLDELRARGVRHSVGVVGLKEHLPLAQRLRRELPDETYLWINAYKSEGPGYYGAGEAEAFARIDPHFSTNNARHPSLGASCRTGNDAITVDGDGEVRRCHFVDERLGNLYRDPLGAMLRERPCPNATCGCFIGYVHLDRLGLYAELEGGVLERIPMAARPVRLAGALVKREVPS